MQRFEWLMNDMSTISLFCIFNRTTVTVFSWNVFPTSPPSPLYKRNMLKSMNYYRHIIPNDASFLYREKTSLPSIFYTYPTENFFYFFGIVTIYLYNIIVFVYRIVWLAYISLLVMRASFVPWNTMIWARLLLMQRYIRCPTHFGIIFYCVLHLCKWISPAKF